MTIDINSTILTVTLVLFLVAFIFSMLGLGGAVLYIPILIWFGYDFKSIAIQTGLFLNGVTALTAAIYFLKTGMVDLKGSLPMIIIALLAAPLGAWWTTGLSTESLLVIFSIIMGSSGLVMLLGSRNSDPIILMSIKKRYLLTSASGLAGGFSLGLLGIGGGFIFVPILIAAGYPTKKAMANSALVVAFSSFAGFSAHIYSGQPDAHLLFFTTAAVIIASWTGAKIMAEKMNPQWLKKMFGSILLVIALMLR